MVHGRHVFNRSASVPFIQLYTVHGLSQGRQIVGAYGLLPNKRSETYIEFLTQIQNFTNQVNPQSVMIDFEQSMIGALDRVYPAVPQKGCLFHLSKNIYKRVHQEGLSQLYMNDDVFRTNIRMISALSFVPIADTVQAFDALCNHAGNQEQVILDYFEMNYIGELRRGRLLAGAAAQPQRRIYSDITERIQTLVYRYANNNIIDFLRRISYNLA